MGWDDLLDHENDPGGSMPKRPGFLNALAVRRGMERHGLDVKRLAVQVGVSAVTVRSWLGGRSAPSPSRLAALATALDLDPAQLTGVPSTLQTLADLRIHSALNQSQAAARVGTSRTSLSDYELGVSELPEALIPALAETYKVTADEVIDAWQRSRDTLGPVR
ncbi:helix-turn-helix transcriptional regulator [Dietzia kunjamensis]|uniref:helix-turn-helix transcriptional regulator n=1 Tax=Dietzia kunjamensis TaxID=322509 RepID=UPI00306CBE84